MLLQIYWTVVLIFSTLFLIYFNILVLSSNENFVKSFVGIEKTVTETEVKNNTSDHVPIKKLVGYSLLKQIELDGEKIFCEDLESIDEIGGKNRGDEVNSNIKDYGNNEDNITISDEYFNKNYNKIIGDNIQAAENWTKIDDSEVYVNTVNYDDRLEPYHYLRIIGAVKGSWNDSIYCQIYDGRSTVKFHTIRATVVPIWYRKWNQNDNSSYFNPVLISCRVPLENNTRLDGGRVALSQNPCEPNQNVFQFHYKSSKPVVNFTICVKPLDFGKDISENLIQWIEINKVLGAERFHIFVENIGRKTEKILKWYTKNYPQKFIIQKFQQIQENEKSSDSNIIKKIWQRRKYEIVIYNSCFYKNLNSKYVIPLDIDEIIVPKLAKNWLELLKNTSKFENHASLLVRNVYFFGNSTKPTAIFFDNDQRTKLLPTMGDNSKSFISTKHALTIFNHYSLRSLTPSVPNFNFLPLSLVQLNHYKKSCDSLVLEKCFRYVFSRKISDNSIFRFRDKFFVIYKNVSEKIKKDLRLF